MTQKITSFLKHIKLYVEYYFAFISAVGIIWGGFIAYHNWSEDNKSLRDDVKNIMQTQKNHTDVDSILLENQTEINDKLNTIQQQTKENSDHLKILETSYIKYLSRDKALSKEDFLKYMDGLTYEAKKKITSTASVK